MNGGKILLGKEMASHCSTFPEKPHNREAWWATGAMGLQEFGQITERLQQQYIKANL